jgi:hypothetical protein
VVPGAGGGGAGPAGGSPGAGATPAANQSFWNEWTAPEQKDTRDWIANKNYADTFTLAKTAQGLEKEAATLRTAANLKAYPADKLNPDGTVTKADPNAVQAWRTSMGVPETADKYDITPPKDEPYPQFTDYMKEALHKAAVPPAMAKVLYDEYNAQSARLLRELRTAEDATSATALKELEMEWGSNYKERVALGARGKEILGKDVGNISDEQWRSMEKTFGTTKMMSFLWKIGAGNTEASFAGGSGGGSGFEGGASAAQAEWDQIMADRGAGKINNYQWNDPKAIAHRDDLVARIANGNASTN